MGTKLQFNIEDAGLSVDGTEVITSARAVNNLTVAADKLASGTIAAARLPYTITSSAPTGVGSTSSGHVWYVYS
tara:strand:+ start:906 stop:1127 length:222 start_codon:yes stop_codon:yes gene_type:complete